MSKRPTGSITVITGSMFAGKTEELIRRARRALYAKRSIQVFKPRIDNRFDAAMVVSHQGIQFEATPVAGMAELKSLVKPETETILIEEAQFFDMSVVETVQAFADSGKEVVVAGLDQDFRREPFGPMPRLLAIADEVVKLRAICMVCGEPASHTYRQIDGKPAHWDDPIVLIGADERYEARCRRCFKLRGARDKKRS